MRPARWARNRRRPRSTPAPSDPRRAKKNGLPLGEAVTSGTEASIELRGRALGGHFPLLVHHGELQLQLVTGDGAFVFCLHRTVLRFPLYGERDVVSLDLAV